MNMTARLKISPLMESHATDTYAQLQNEEIYHYIPDLPPLTVESLKMHYADLAQGASSESEKWLNWVIAKKECDEIVGTLQSTVMLDEGIAYIAYVIFPPYWGKGYAFEGVLWMIEHLKKMENIECVIAEIDTRNARSIKLIEKHEFRIKETIPTEEGKDHVYVKSIR